jgi:hypothetical protein
VVALCHPVVTLLQKKKPDFRQSPASIREEEKGYIKTYLSKKRQCSLSYSSFN